MEAYILVQKCLATEWQAVVAFFSEYKDAVECLEKCLEIDGYSFGYRISLADVETAAIEIPRILWANSGMSEKYG